MTIVVFITIASTKNHDNTVHMVNIVVMTDIIF